MAKVPGPPSPLPIHKTVLLGGSAVGKSALALRFIHNDFIPIYEPTKTDVYTKKIVLDGEEVQINIVDTAGKEEYPALRNNFIKDGEGFLIVFSITDEESFNTLQKYRDEVILVKGGNHIPMILVGNKCDLDHERLVPTAAAVKLSKRWNIPYVETTAKYNRNVEKAFMDLLRSIETQKLSQMSTTGQGRSHLCCEIL